MRRWSVSILWWCALLLSAIVYMYGHTAPLNAQGQSSSRQPVARQAATSPSDADHIAFRKTTIDKYCVSCHNSRTKTAGLALDAVDLSRVTDAPQLWEKVVRKMRDGAMPPSGLPRPDKIGYDRFASSLEARLDAAK